jgi:DNA-binding beta-propeller fold protein YncE
MFHDRSGDILLVERMISARVNSFQLLTKPAPRPGGYARRVERMTDPPGEIAMRRPRRMIAPMLVGLIMTCGGCSNAHAQHDAAAIVPTAQTSTPSLTTVPATTNSTAVQTSTSRPETTTSRPEPTTSRPEPTSTVPPSTAEDVRVNVYAAASAGALSPVEANDKAYAYVPSNDDGSVTVIDQGTLQVVDHYKVGKLVQHVVADWDLTMLYATVSDSNQLVAIDPATGKRGRSIPVAAPYNLYFTPDGSKAVVMAERLNRMDFYDRLTWKKIASTPTGRCHGVNHADWSADGTFFLATCEYSGGLIKVDSNTGEIVGTLDLPPGSMPQDLRLAPDGTKFYTADMEHGCVWIIDGTGTTLIGSIDTGIGAHGIYPSRDAKLMYVTNRGRTKNDTRRKSREGDGSISVIDPTTDQVVATWEIPGGGSPDMGGVSADGSTLWVSGRYDAVVYVFDTSDGTLKAKIPVPRGPHGLNLFPQPGRYSLGHTDSYR